MGKQLVYVYSWFDDGIYQMAHGIKMGCTSKQSDAYMNLVDASLRYEPCWHGKAFHILIIVS